MFFIAQPRPITPVSTRLAPVPATPARRATDCKPAAEKQTGAFYDLEFCLWLMANFDYIIANYPQWHEEVTRRDEQVSFGG